MKKAGHVALIGWTNSGKSTLLNSIFGRKVATITHKKQTTLDNKYIVYTKLDSQIVFIDTPGFNINTKHKYRVSNSVMYSAIENSDAILFVIDGASNYFKECCELITSLKKYKVPIIIANNKMDLQSNVKQIENIEHINKTYDLNTIVPISALKQKGIDQLIDEVTKYLIKQDFLYPSDVIFLDSKNKFIEDLIKEKVLLNLHKEVPYGIQVEMDTALSEKKEKISLIYATIFCDSSSHKIIAIGKNGQKIKQIGTAARKELEFLLNRKIFLKLNVKIKK